jgi:prephenate dehydratase
MNASGKPTRIVSYLGGRGSFSEEACKRLLPNHDLMPLPDFEAVAMAVCQGTADLAVLPVHNSLIGPIDAVLVLLAHPELRKIKEEDSEIRLHLLAAPGTAADSIVEVASHKAALLQCAAFIEARRMSAIQVASTAEAARQAGDLANPVRAAIASEAAAEIYGLTIVERDVQGEAASITRFAIVERRDQFA